MATADDDVMAEDAGLLNVLPIALVTVTSHHVITFANAAAEHLLGAGLATLKGSDLRGFLQPYAEIEHAITQALAHNAPLREFDLTLAGPRMASIHASLQVVPMDDAGSALLLIDNRSMEIKLSRHKAGREGIKSASQMASILAHEVKNPLAGIRGAAQLLSATVSEDDRPLTELIRNEVDRIRGLIEEMEIFSNPSELRMLPVNIHEILDYVRNLVETGTENQCRFHLRYDPSIPPVNGNRNLLIQLFLNLMGNAAHALKDTENATITLSTAYESGFRLKPWEGAVSHALPIVVTVQDNGPGIAAQVRDHIFEPFVTGRERGKGLGLAIAAKIVTDHGGIIEADMDIEQGARFRVRLPAA